MWASQSFARSPATVGLISGSCSSARAFAPRFFQAPPRGECYFPLALRYDFTSIWLSKGLSPSICRTCSAHKLKGRIAPPFCLAESLCCQFLGLAFVTHQLERALGLLVRGRDLLLHLGGSLFHFWRETHVAVVLHAGAGWDEAPDDDVLLQAAQV